MQRMKAVALSTFLTASALFAGAVHADKTLDAILEVSQSKTTAAQQSQKRIDKLASETADIFSDFKIVNKEIEGLRVYNALLEKQLDNQRKVIERLEKSISDVTVIERQIQPLILRMLDGLEQFVDLDTPLYKEERIKRINDLRNNQDRADITVAEKFRQVLEAYNIESEYARKLHIYTDTLQVGGQDRQVNVLGIGKIALVYQTTDTQYSGAWDQSQRSWVPLDSGEYRAAILKGIRIAKQQASTNIMEIPVLAPGAIQ